MPWKRLSALAAALVLTGALAVDAFAQRDRDRDRDGDRRDWVLLGERRVDFKAERDVINIGQAEDWWRDRGFRRLHLIAERSDIHLMSVRLVYMNGFSEDFNVDRMIREGQDQPIDLRGERKYLQRIELFYRSRPSFEGRATMKVYGVPSRFGPRPDAIVQPDRDGGRRDWVLLGERRVDFRAERDAINVGQAEDWWRDRGFRRLHLVAERSDIHLMSLRLVYMNGFSEDFNVDRLIREGQDQPIDLRGERKYLQRIELFYRSRPSFEGRAVMKVYGVPSRFGPRPDAIVQPDRDGGRRDWVELGCKRVSLFGVDRDTINVGRREGRFKAIRMHVTGADIQLLDLTVIYTNGAPDTLRVRSTLREGARTGALDLRGWERSIDRIEMSYVTIPNFKGQARVCAEGLQ